MQWGYAQKPTSEYDFYWVYPIPFPTLVGAIMLTPQYEGQCRVHSINSFDRFSCSFRTDGTRTDLNSNHVFAIGFQQWGNAGSNNGSVDVTFPISFTKAVYQIQLTYNNSSYENPTYEIKDTKSFSYWSKYGGDKLWLAIGVQQWGYCNNGSQISFPMAYKTKCYAITFGVHYNGSQYGYNQVVSYNTLGFTMYQTVGTNGLAIMWIALGVQQWGLSDNIQRQTITFPISFPKICYHITWTATSSAGNPYKTSGYVNSVTNISFLARADDTACQKYWFAVGV